jgi:hypothetical protein
MAMVLPADERAVEARFPIVRAGQAHKARRFEDVVYLEAQFIGPSHQGQPEALQQRVDLDQVNYRLGEQLVELVTTTGWEGQAGVVREALHNGFHIVKVFR